MTGGNCEQSGDFFAPLSRPLAPCPEGQVFIKLRRLSYADGYPRLLSNKGRVIINGEEMKIADNSVKDYLGYNVSYLYSFDKEDENEKTLIYVKDNKTKILELTEENEISSTTDARRRTINQKLLGNIFN